MASNGIKELSNVIFRHRLETCRATFFERIPVATAKLDLLFREVDI